MPQRADAHRLFTGSFYPDLESALAESVAHFRKTRPPLTPLSVVVPSNLLKVYLRRRLVELGQPHVALEFLSLQELVARSLPETTDTLRSLPPLAEELIADHVIRENVTENSYFYPVRHAAGFRAALVAAFKDLKEAGISSAAFSACIKKKNKLDENKFDQLATLFRAYGQQLAAHRAEDAADALARAAVSERDPLADRGDVFLYGFYDFNFLQRQFITQLAAHHPLTVFFPYHPSEIATREHGGGAFLYAEPTLHWFSSLLGVEPEPVSGDPDTLSPTLFEFRARLFNEARDKFPIKPNRAHLEILSLPHEPREAVEILRDSLSFCLSNTADNSKKLFHVAVLPRQAEPCATLIQETAQARNIPIQNFSGRALLESVEARSYLKLLDVAQSDFGRAAVMEFATLAPLQSEKLFSAELLPGLIPSEWDRLSAKLGIVKGIETWQRRLTSHLGHLAWKRANLEPDDDAPPLSVESQKAETTTRSLDAFIQSLTASLQPLQRARETTLPWSKWVDHSIEAFRKLLKPSDAFSEVVAAIEPLAALEPFQPTVSLEIFAQFARKALMDENLRDAKFEDSGIFVGGLMAARGLSWPMVVLPGLVEKSFPRLIREDPILLDAEREIINRAFPDNSLASPTRSHVSTLQRSDALPLRLDLKRRGYEEERMLFQLAVESTRERLVLTFPRLDPSSGRPRVPSMLLLHASEALTGEAPDYSQLEKCPVFRSVPLNESNPADFPLDETEENLALFSELRAKKNLHLAPLLQTITPRLAEGLRCEQTRWGDKTFTIYDGILTNADALVTVAQWLDPAAREFSTTSFEQFVRCPRCFFENRLLEIEDFDEPEETISLPPRETGNLVHDVLSKTMKRLATENLLPMKREDGATHRRILEGIAAKTFDEFEKKGFTGIPLLWEIQRAWLLADFLSLLEREYKTQEDEGVVPIAFEWPFGQQWNQLEKAEPAAVVRLKSGLVLHFHGKIDRVDKHPEGGWLKVVDYKTGKVPPDIQTRKEAGQLLQIPLYSIAATQLGGISRAGELYYATAKGKFARVQWTEQELTDAARALPDVLEILYGSMAQGIFLQRRDCDYCGGSTLFKSAVKTLFDMKRDDPRTAVLLAAMGL